MIDDLNAYIGRIIMSTCNEIGCADCPFASCEVTRVQNQVAELERNITMLAPDKGQAAVVKDNLVSTPCG